MFTVLQPLLQQSCVIKSCFFYWVCAPSLDATQIHQEHSLCCFSAQHCEHMVLKNTKTAMHTWRPSFTTYSPTHWCLAWFAVCCPLWEPGAEGTQGKHLSSKSPGHAGCTMQPKTSHVCSHQGHSTWCLSPPYPEQHPILIGVIQFWWAHCHLSAKMKHTGAIW